MKSGFLLVDKPLKLSSQNVDYKIKKIFNTKKAGHLGTLDPLATGLLVVAVNSATRYFKYFDESRKTYILSIRLGASSPSLDNETEPDNYKDTDYSMNESFIDSALESFSKEYDQYPPLYSAVKINGQPLYKYAVKEKEVDIPSRHVYIYGMKRISDVIYKDGSSYFEIELNVSKGFYVRSFARDFATVLNTFGMADSIRRIKVDDFKIEDASLLENISEENLIDPVSLLKFRKAEIPDNSLKYVLNGSSYKLKEYMGEYVILTHNGENIAIYKSEEKSTEYKMDLLIKNESIIH